MLGPFQITEKFQILLLVIYLANPDLVLLVWYFIPLSQIGNFHQRKKVFQIKYTLVQERGACQPDHVLIQRTLFFKLDKRILIGNLAKTSQNIFTMCLHICILSSLCFESNLRDGSRLLFLVMGVVISTEFFPSLAADSSHIVLRICYSLGVAFCGGWLAPMKKERQESSSSVIENFVWIQHLLTLLRIRKKRGGKE